MMGLLIGTRWSTFIQSEKQYWRTPYATDDFVHEGMSRECSGYSWFMPRQFAGIIQTIFSSVMLIHCDH